MKIVSTGRTLSIPEYHQRRQRARRRKFAFFCIGIVALLALLVFLSRQPRFLISKIEVAGAKAISADEVTSLAQKNLAGSYFWLLPRSNFLIYPRGGIKESLLKEFSRFSSVGISLNGTKSLDITVVEREPFALYCPDLGRDSCYFLDENGFIFDRAPAFFGNVYFIYAKNLPITNPVSTEFLPSAEFKQLTNFIKNLASFDIYPLSLEVSESEFTLRLPHSARIIFLRGGDLNLIYSNLSAFLNDESIKSQKDFLEKIESLDLRTDNKVFYKFK